MDTTTLVILASIGGTVLFLIGVPVFLVLGLWIVMASNAIGFTLSNIPTTLFEGINFFGLLALPLFILTGDMISAAGIARRLTDFSRAALSWLSGGMAISTLGACGLFAAISGSNAATTATIGKIMYPQLVDENYDKRFAAATIAAGGVVGIIIPPSVIFIVYGFIMNLPIGTLFIAGLLPGILMVIAMQMVALYMAWRNGWGMTFAFSLKKTLIAGAKAYLGFLAIFIVLFGIYSGIFSPTEAAAMTVGYCFVAGTFVTREIKLRQVPSILMSSGQITGLLAPLIAISIVMQQMFSLMGAEQAIRDFVMSFGGGYAVTLAVCMAIVLITGTILESLPVTVILAPVLAPLAAHVGVDPVHFAVIFLVGASIGFITPPYGLNLYVASSVTSLPYLQLVRFVVPYFVALVLVWALVAAFPVLSLWLTQFM
ncbi:TRAP transporter large permease [Filomicrobium sp.]|uniref:TRAP transporter large permease n=1 Tax=Filomicrobium sp. TaxID=2024831 RepID=UPI002584D303|nr:TRAP transporter large permease [Filomicrobium sp.]MCV0370906.1 TRAP transporter large permease [Filomicrobium sp.]